MGELEDLKKQLQEIRSRKNQVVIKKQKEDEIKQLKRQIKGEKFAQTKSGKVFNKIADIGMGAKKYLSTPPKQQSGSSKKKKAPVRISVEQMMARLPQ